MEAQMPSMQHLAGLAVAAVCGSILVCREAVAQDISLCTNYFDTSISFNDCMKRSSAALRAEGFEIQVSRDKNGTGGVRGSIIGAFVCGPRNVAFLAVAGPSEDEVNRIAKGLVDSFKR
jgi:hypothetical protein